MSRIDPHRLEASFYPLKIAILARYADVDPLWHINNVAIAQFYEEARVTAGARMFGDVRIPTPAGERVLIAHQSIDYLHEAAYPGTLEVGIGVLRIGNASYTLGMGMFQDGRCVSVSDAVMVFADPSGPARLPDLFRRRLEAWLLGAGSPRHDAA
jgi:acyl-CoA thioester hydrolase